MVDVKNAIIVDVEAATAIRQAEALVAKRMIPAPHFVHQPGCVTHSFAKKNLHLPAR
jgi:hypothetical protein